MSKEAMRLSQKIGRLIEVYDYIKQCEAQRGVYISKVVFNKPIIGGIAELRFYYVDAEHPANSIDYPFGYYTDFEFEDLSENEVNFIEKTFIVESKEMREWGETGAFMNTEYFNIHLEWLEKDLDSWKLD